MKKLLALASILVLASVVHGQPIRPIWTTTNSPSVVTNQIQAAMGNNIWLARITNLFNNTNLVLSFHPVNNVLGGAGKILFEIKSDDAQSTGDLVHMVVDPFHDDATPSLMGSEIECFFYGNLALVPGNNGGLGTRHLQFGCCTANVEAGQTGAQAGTAGNFPSWIHMVATQPWNGLPGYSGFLGFNSAGTMNSGEPAGGRFSGIYGYGSTNAGDPDYGLKFAKTVWVQQEGSIVTGDSIYMSNNLVGADMFNYTNGTTYGWKFYGSVNQDMIRQDKLAAAVVLDLGKANCLDIRLFTNTVTLTTANELQYDTNFATYDVLFRSGGYCTPTITANASWSMETNVSTAFASPWVMSTNQILHLHMLSVGPGETNKIVSAWLTQDNTSKEDADATNWFGVTGISDNRVKNAVHWLARDAKAHYWWTNCDAIYPMAGGTSNGCSINLKDRTKFNIAWTNTGMTYASGGVTGDGSHGSGNTGFTPSTGGTQLYTNNSAHLFLWLGNETQNNSYLMGALGSGSQYSALDVITFSAQIQAPGLNDDAGAGGAAATVTLNGPVMATRNTSTNFFLYVKEGASMATRTTTSVPDRSIYLMALNSGTVSLFSDSTFKGATIGNGISFGRWRTMTNDWNNFNTSLGR